MKACADCIINEETQTNQRETSQRGNGEGKEASENP